VFIRKSPLRSLALLALAATALAGCQRNPLVVTRSPCPAVAVPTYAGDLTAFAPGASPDAGNLDFVATITNVRSTCAEGADQLVSDIRYDIVARRESAAGARSVSLPVFASVVQGGNLVVSKQVGSVTIAFADGQLRSTTGASARSTVSRAAASLPAAVQARINRKRRAGDPDAAVDPMADPEVRAALRAASFEVLVGFQLSEAQLAYNVTK
jgi:hypothetical protein